MTSDIANPTGHPDPSRGASANAAPPKNTFERIVGVLFSPGETFADIARKPDILLPLIIFVIIGYASAAVMMPRMDFESVISKQRENMRKQQPKMSEQDLARFDRIAVASTKVGGWLSPLLAIIFYVVVAAVFLFAFRVMGGEGTFLQAFSATLYSWIPLLIFSIISTIVILARGTFDPLTTATLVKSNPAFLVDMNAQPVLFAFLASLDVFIIWTLVLMVFGFAAMAKVSRGKSAAIVASVYVVFVLLRMGLAALQAMMGA